MTHTATAGKPYFSEYASDTKPHITRMIEKTGCSISVRDILSNLSLNLSFL